MKKKANIYDVANLAGVSHQTVSRVLNNHPSLKPETKEKVEKAIAQLDYKPNQAARQLVTSKSRMIGILVVGSELYGPSAIKNAMEIEARKAGYTVVSISVLAHEPDSWREGIEQLRNLNIDGVITVALPRAIVSEIKKRLAGAELVVVDTEPSKESDVVNIDNQVGGRLATEHLIDLGHKEIVHITGPADAYESEMRKIGYEEAMKKAKLKVNIVQGDWSIDTGYEIGLKLAKKVPSAIFCSNDHLALGLIKAFSQNKIQVPKDVSVIGFDNIPESKYLLPALTTIKQDFEELGRVAITKVLSQIKESTKAETVMIKPTLIQRESTSKRK
ncbi:MAG: LacI family DNA-binding transcriptional regulator [Candidatus Nanopelagicaceae bacterium]|jgi:DNA-binding LacI/PurR family transcriptional regulator